MATTKLNEKTKAQKPEPGIIQSLEKKGWARTQAEIEKEISAYISLIKKLEKAAQIDVKLKNEKNVETKKQLEEEKKYIEEYIKNLKLVKAEAKTSLEIAEQIKQEKINTLMDKKNSVGMMFLSTEKYKSSFLRQSLKIEQKKSTLLLQGIRKNWERSSEIRQGMSRLFSPITGPLQDILGDFSPIFDGIKNVFSGMYDMGHGLYMMRKVKGRDEENKIEQQMDLLRESYQHLIDIQESAGGKFQELFANLSDPIKEFQKNYETILNSGLKGKDFEKKLNELHLETLKSSAEQQKEIQIKLRENQKDLPFSAEAKLTSSEKTTKDIDKLSFAKALKKNRDEETKLEKKSQPEKNKHMTAAMFVAQKKMFVMKWGTIALAIVGVLYLIYKWIQKLWESWPFGKKDNYLNPKDTSGTGYFAGLTIDTLKTSNKEKIKTAIHKIENSDNKVKSAGEGGARGKYQIMLDTWKQAAPEVHRTKEAWLAQDADIVEQTMDNLLASYQKTLKAAGYDPNDFNLIYTLHFAGEKAGMKLIKSEADNLLDAYKQLGITDKKFLYDVENKNKGMQTYAQIVKSASKRLAKRDKDTWNEMHNYNEDATVPVAKRPASILSKEWRGQQRMKKEEMRQQKNRGKLDTAKAMDDDLFKKQNSWEQKQKAAEAKKQPEITSNNTNNNVVSSLQQNAGTRESTRFDGLQNDLTVMPLIISNYT